MSNQKNYEQKPSFCEAVSQRALLNRADAILADVRSKSQESLPKGITVPVLFLDRCSDEDKSVVCQALEYQAQEAIAAELRTPLVLSDQPSMAQPFPHPYHSSCIQSLSHLLGRLPSKNNNGLDSYNLMHLLLGRICLRRCNGRFYVLDGYVYRPVPDLKALVFDVLEPELALGKTNILLRNVVDLLESYPKIGMDGVRLSVSEVPFLNGIFNLRSGILRQVTPYDFFTSYINVPYPSGEVQCPVFDQFVSTISGGSPDIISAIWEMLGYLLTSDMSGKAFFVLQGVGDSGKSVLGNLIASFFNDEAVAHLDIFRLGDRFSPSVLQGKHLNVCMDLPDGKIHKEAVGAIKQITGGDAITVEGKFKAAASLRPSCKFLFGTNFSLRMEQDEAFESRCIIIPFLYPVPKESQDKHLLEKLMEERPAIAVKALMAYQRLRQRNYEFINPGAHNAFTGWGSLISQLERFLADCCEFGPAPQYHTSAIDLFSCFNAFCRAKGLGGCDDLVQFSRQLGQVCRDRIAPRRKRGPGGNLNGYDGISIRYIPEQGGDLHG